MGPYLEDIAYGRFVHSSLSRGFLQASDGYTRYRPHYRGVKESKGIGAVRTNGREPSRTGNIGSGWSNCSGLGIRGSCYSPRSCGCEG